MNHYCFGDSAYYLRQYLCAPKFMKTVSNANLTSKGTYGQIRRAVDVKGYYYLEAECLGT